MAIEIDNTHFCIRLYKDVGYFKAIGFHGKEEAQFFANMVDEMLQKYSYPSFATLCNFKEMVLSEPLAALEINKTIKRIANSVDYKCNAIVASSAFFDIMKAYVFSFYLRNIHVNTRVFHTEGEALKWIRSFDFNTEEVDRFIQSQKSTLLP